MNYLSNVFSIYPTCYICRNTQISFVRLRSGVGFFGKGAHHKIFNVDSQ